MIHRFRTPFVLTILLVAISLSAGQASDSHQALYEFKGALKRASDAFSGISRYTATVQLQERHNGQLRDIENVMTYYVKAPLKVCFYWNEGGLFAGMKASYVQDRDGPEHFMARAPGVKGLVGVQRYHLDSKVIQKLYPHHLRTNLYHIGFLLDLMMDLHKKALENNSGKIEVQHGYRDPVTGKSLTLFKMFLAEKPGNGMPYRRTAVGFDEKTGLPMRIMAYNFSDQLHQSYVFTSMDVKSSIDPAVFEIQ